MDRCVYMDLRGNCIIEECTHKERVCDARKEKCEYEDNNGNCTLNECMYGDFLFIDDSAFGTGKYCLCDGVIDKMEQFKEQKNE